MSHVERAHGEGQRRRDRMVRSWWRHEQRRIAATVATMLHHSAGRKPHPTLVDAATQVGSLLAPVTEYVAPAPAVVCDVPATVIETMSSAPVVECVAPATARTYVVPSQQLTPVFSTTTVTTDLVYPQFSSTAVEPYVPCVVGSLPLVEEFSAPVYDQGLQEHIAASEFMENFAEIPVVHEQVIVQDTPQVVDSLPLDEEFTGPVYDQVHQELVASSEMTENFAEIPVVHEQVIVGLRPERLVDAQGPQGGLERAAPPCAVVPSLSLPSLGDDAGHDVTSTQFLRRCALAQRERERVKEAETKRQKRFEEREEVKKRADEIQSLLAVPRDLRTPAQLRRFQELAAQSSDSWAFLRRKRKKKRKKKAPKASSSRGRARRRQRQWHFCGAGSAGYVPLPVFPLVSGRLVMLGIMAGMEQKGFKFVDIPFVQQRQFPLVQTIHQTTEILQLLFDFRWSMPLLCGSCSFSCAAVETFLALPQLQLVEKSSPVFS